jgi:hypothetical protein
MKRKNLLVVVFILVSSIVCSSVYAVEYPAPIKIQSITVSSVGNFNFRIQSNGTSWLCANGPSGNAWAYVEETDSGAKEKIATLLTAYTLGKTIALVTEGILFGSTTYCHIRDFTVSD